MSTKTKTKTKGGALRHVVRDIYVAKTRLVRTTKSFKTLNSYQHPATHILSEESPLETLCGYRDFVVVGGTADETHLCNRCRVKLMKKAG